MVCNCFNGWTGDDCDTAGCQTGDCLNGGWCSYEDSSAGVCMCLAGWSEADCGTAVNVTGPCSGNGWVNSDDNCVCFNGWMGADCATAGCQVGDCMNGGWCSYAAGPAGACLCQTGFIGADCGTVDTTASTCVNGWIDGNMDCNCFIGWQGANCSTPGCQFGIDCIGGYCSYESSTAGVCVCTNGFTGVTCNVAPSVSPSPTPGLNPPGVFWQANPAHPYITDKHCDDVCEANPPACYCEDTPGFLGLPYNYCTRI